MQDQVFNSQEYTVTLDYMKGQQTAQNSADMICVQEMASENNAYQDMKVGDHSQNVSALIKERL